MREQLAASWAVACLAFAVAGCAVRGPAARQTARADTEADALGPDPVGSPAQYPIVLAHGFGASTDAGFHGIADALAADGHTVVTPTDVPPFGTVADRAAALARAVDGAIANGAAKVNIIAHSMGGLDARYLVGSMGYGDRVASITTISTPHQGTAVADVALAAIDATGAPDSVVDALASLWGLSQEDMLYRSDLRSALLSLSEAGAPAFNDQNADDSRVSYQSWAGVSSPFGIKRRADIDACGTVLGDYAVADEMHAKLAPLYPVTGHGWALIPNDGLVEVDSAKWGAFQGCIPADHYKEDGYPNAATDPRTNFDPIRFYRNLAFGLAAAGL